MTMQVTSQDQANRLNANGHTDPYRAANFHTMIAPVDFPVMDGDEDKPYREQRQRDYRVGDRIQYRSYAAECTDTCAACAEGDPLPDF